MIKVEKLSRSFGPKKVLKDINLEMYEGNCYGVVGSNGAGKSTLFNCMSQNLSFKGRISSDDINLRDQLVYLPTDIDYFPLMTAEEYLQYVTKAAKLDVKDLNKWNLFALPLKEYADNYSTGMKKKLAITGVLMQGKSTLLLDEPFNGIDLQSNMLLKDIVLHLKTMKKIIMISSHVFSTLTEICDCIFYLNNGIIEKAYLHDAYEQLEEKIKSEHIGDVLAGVEF